MFHMAWFLKQGFGVHGWDNGWSGPIADEWTKPDLYIDMGRQLEKAGFDYMMIEDSLLVNDAYQGNMDFALRRAHGVPKSDPMPLLPLIAYGTKHIGVVGTIATPFYPPYTAARLGATLDQLTQGRVGLNLVTASSHRSAQNYGLDSHYEHDHRYEMAHEWMDCVDQLWGSWEPGAVIADKERGVYADFNKVHTVNFEGKFYKSRGPLNTIPGPQRRPVICQAGGSPAGRAFGAKHADTIIASASDIPSMKEYREDISKRMIAEGRDPKSCKVLFLITTIVGDSASDAEDRVARQRAAESADYEHRLERLSYYSGIDMAQYDLDAPLPREILTKVNGHQSTMIAAVESGKTLRQIAKEPGSMGLEVHGTPDAVASQMGEMVAESDADGYLIYNTITRKSISEVADGLAPALRRRGLIRDGYEHKLFRDNLLAF